MIDFDTLIHIKRTITRLKSCELSTLKSKR